MPLYFAYGSNMDATALRTRSPGARALGLVCLLDHRFVLMGNGYASVVRDAADRVHGMLFDLASSDIALLDRYEEVDRGMYTKIMLPVERATGGSCQALIYIGADATIAMHSCIPDYMEDIVETARSIGLPEAYVTMLGRHIRRQGTP